MSATVFDLDDIPFSTRGSWLSLSRVVGLHEHAELVHLVSHTTGMHPVLSLGLVPTGRRSRIEASPEVLRWTADGGAVEAAFDGTATLRLRGHGVGMRLGEAAGRLTPFTGSYLYVSPLDGAAVLTSYETGRRYRVTALAGAVEVTGAERLGEAERSVTAGADGEPWELAIEELVSDGAPYLATLPFDEVVAARAAEFAAYAHGIAPWAAAADTARLAAYVLWSATVAPAGFVTREAVLMSKHWMDKVWSWDHCFNALALAASEPRAALDQFLLPFDHQADTGALPDSVTHSEVLYNFVKPPIHGWVWSLLRGMLPAELLAEAREEVHAHLAAWTRYWLDHRRAPGSALPFYEHGNDSGWDNATVFDGVRLVTSPDLAAFLVLQLEQLAELTAELGRDPQPWRAEASRVQRALVSQLRAGDRLVARAVADNAMAPASSLLVTLPLLLGKRLDAPLRAALTADVAAHLTEFGPATEPVTSPHYEADGYWRGPIWAPSTFIVEAGLRASGEAVLAHVVRERFLALCERHGFAENFDALTGAGLRDRAYTWTAAVYLLFDRARQVL